MDSSEILEVCRKEVMEWDKEVVRVARVLYALLSEGLGLGAERLTEMGLVEGRVMVGHYYFDSWDNPCIIWWWFFRYMRWWWRWS